MRADISSSARVIELCYETNRAVVRFEGLPPEIGNQVAFLPLSAAEPLARVNDEGFIVECSDLPLAPGLLLYGAPQAHPAEPKLPESATVKDCLTVVAWLYTHKVSGASSASDWRWHATHAAREFHLETHLVRLTDAESALKARDAEIERLRGDVERYQWLRRYPNNLDGRVYGPTYCRNEGGLLRRDDYLDAAIDQARAEGGEKANG